MTALPGHDPVQPHVLPDSERILRAHGGWQREWDERKPAIQEQVLPEHDEQVKYAIQLYARGLLPIQVRWELAERFGRDCRIGSVQRSAERAIQSASEAPAPLRRAQVALMRQTAIQGAIQDRCWGPALAGIARAGEVAGELDREAQLGPEDLRLVVAIEGDEDTPLPPASADTNADQTGEPADTDSDQAEG